MNDVLEQLRAIADGRSSAPDKAQHPDAELLRAVATYLDLCAEAGSIEREARRKPAPYVGCAEFDAAARRWKEKEAEARRVLNRLGKMRAATPAGIYAKVTVVATRGKFLTAPCFIQSLVTDLVNNTTLRASLWPPEVA